MKKIIVFPLLLSLFSCVYFPGGRYVWDPVPLYGVITDCNNNLAIEGALVSSSNHSDKVKTDVKGFFMIKGKRTTIHIAGFGDSYVNGVLIVSAKGFVSLKKNIRYGSPSHKEKEIGALCLSHLST